MKNASNESSKLLDSARKLAPLLREHADRGEQERRLPQPVVDALRGAGIFRMCRPKELGGLEVDPVTVIDVVEELSHADGSGGWCAMISGAGSVIKGFVSKRGATEMFSDPNVVSGGVVAPTGRAIEVDGGYRVTGRWAMASGCQHCNWLGGNCVVFDGQAPRPGPGGMPECVIPFFSSSEFRVVDTWTVSGLRGTGSHDFEVSEVFVPSHRCIRMPPAPSPHERPLYKFPFFGFLALSVASSGLGIARAAIDELAALARTKTPFGMMSKLSTRPSAQIAVSEAAATLGAARSFLREATADTWEAIVAGKPPSADQRARLRLAATNAAMSSARAVDLVYTAGGATAVYAKSPLQRCLRDIHMVTQHYAVAAPNHEMCGRILLGAAPDDPML